MRKRKISSSSVSTKPHLSPFERALKKFYDKREKFFANATASQRSLADHCNGRREPEEIPHFLSQLNVSRP
jgi:hypothetical protein